MSAKVLNYDVALRIAANHVDSEYPLHLFICMQSHGFQQRRMMPILRQGILESHPPISIISLIVDIATRESRSTCFVIITMYLLNLQK